MTTNRISSPCIGTCQLVNGACKGCLRTSEHISNWRHYSEAQRQKIMASLVSDIDKPMAGEYDAGNNCPACGATLPPLDSRAPCLCPACGCHCCEGSV